MDYAQTYFGKPLAELQYTDIERFFAQERQESDQLEFKSYPADDNLEKAIAPVIAGITAFLNSSGGLLIWGAPSGARPQGRTEKVFTGPLTKLPLRVEKDWLVSKIADKIIPLPRGFRLQLVATTEGQVAVFEVDESPYAPHQTSNLYYMRIDGASKPAPHHYIEALFKKVTFPRLDAYVDAGELRGRENSAREATRELDLTFLFFNMSPFLNEERLAYKIDLGLGFFKSNDEDVMGRYGHYTAGRSYSSEKKGDVVVRYGEPHHYVRTLVFTEDELRARFGLVSITLTFGGKAAPLKYCRYYLQFTPELTHVNCYVEHQNRLVVDLMQEQGVTHEERLNDRPGIIRELGPPIL